jgi:hypothetical protein
MLEQIKFWWMVAREQRMTLKFIGLVVVVFGVLCFALCFLIYAVWAAL